MISDHMRGAKRPDVQWRDLLELSPIEKLWELFLPVPWLVSSLFCYHSRWLVVGLIFSFYFFLTALRQAHGAQHYTLGVGRQLQDFLMFILSILMLCSIHAVQTTHLHHHRHCLDAEDVEGSTARVSWWRAILLGPLFPLRLHHAAWQLGSFCKRVWMAAEIAAVLLAVIAIVASSRSHALRWHYGAMVAAESLTGFFAVWLVHHDCSSTGLFARTQRGRWMNWISYNMFYHVEHHLFPAVPTCHLSRLASRLDEGAVLTAKKQVIGCRKD